jgi:hypothetical protein
MSVERLMPGSPASRQFVLSAFDRDQWCPVLQARFCSDDLDALRSILGEQAKDDPELHHQYILNRVELTAVVERFAIAFDPDGLDCKDPDIFFFSGRWLSDTPYLVHTGYELPLLLDGRKKLARMSDGYPPLTFEGEDRFDHWVAEGLLHKEEVLEPFDPPTQRWSGHRTVYYTPKGEEWRIAASKLIWGRFGKTGAWNETLERLEGLLFGYEDWQNDWWIEHVTARRGSVSGASLCCAVTSSELVWIELAGFRALPPVDGRSLDIASYDPDAGTEMRAFMNRKPSSAALVRFNVPGRLLLSFFDVRTGGPWELPADRIPELNRHLRGSVSVVERRDSSSSVSHDP